MFLYDPVSAVHIYLYAYIFFYVLEFFACIIWLDMILCYRFNKHDSVPRCIQAERYVNFVVPILSHLLSK